MQVQAGDFWAIYAIICVFEVLRQVRIFFLSEHWHNNVRPLILMAPVERQLGWVISSILLLLFALPVAPLLSLAGLAVAAYYQRKLDNLKKDLPTVYAAPTQTRFASQTPSVDIASVVNYMASTPWGPTIQIVSVMPIELLKDGSWRCEALVDFEFMDLDMVAIEANKGDIVFVEIVEGLGPGVCGKEEHDEGLGLKPKAGLEHA